MEKFDNHVWVAAECAPVRDQSPRSGPKEHPKSPPQKQISSNLNSSHKFMKTKQSTILAAALTITISSTSATTIFSHDFNGDSSDLNGATTDLGSGTWASSTVFNQDGSIDPNSGSATLAFTPSSGTVYRLDVSLREVSGNGNWFALGFGAGQSTATGSGNRFINGQLIGKSWMLFRGNGDGHQAFRGVQLRALKTDLHGARSELSLATSISVLNSTQAVALRIGPQPG